MTSEFISDDDEVMPADWKYQQRLARQKPVVAVEIVAPIPQRIVYISFMEEVANRPSEDVSSTDPAMPFPALEGPLTTHGIVMNPQLQEMADGILGH